MATAILADDFDADHSGQSHFSVVIDFEEGQASCDESRPAAVSTLVPDLMGEKFAEMGQRFLVMEGPKKVALGEVISLDYQRTPRARGLAWASVRECPLSETEGTPVAGAV